MKKIISVLLVACCLTFCLTSCNTSKYNNNDGNDQKYNDDNGNDQKYNYAVSAANAGRYEEAYDLFYELGDYRDSKNYLKRFTVCYDTMISTSPSGTMLREFAYDSNGNMVKDVIKISGVEVKSTYDSTYDSDGNIVKKVYTDYDGDRTTSTFDNTYDSDGNMVKQIQIFSDGDRITTEYTYDENGNKVKSVETDIYGDRTTTEYTTDKYGNIEKMVDTNSDGEIIYTLVYLGKHIFYKK